MILKNLKKPFAKILEGKTSNFSSNGHSNKAAQLKIQTNL